MEACISANSYLKRLSMHVDKRKLTGCGKRGKWASVFKDKRLVMTSALELLEAFERAGDCIEAFAQSVRSEMTEQEVVKDMAFLLKENGFNLKGKDIDMSNIDCALGIAHEKFKLEMQGLEKRRYFFGQVEDVGMLSSAQSRNFYAEKVRPTGYMVGPTNASMPCVRLVPFSSGKVNTWLARVDCSLLSVQVTA